MEANPMAVDSSVGTPEPQMGVASAVPTGEPMFCEVSVVDCSDIRSQWQARFSGRCPLGMDRLPQQHESDKAFFEKNWRGPKDWHGLPYTYATFMLLHFPSQAPNLFVRKRSGKPFKSGGKIAHVKRLIRIQQPSAMRPGGVREIVTRPAYEFYEEQDGYFVNALMCEAVE